MKILVTAGNTQTPIDRVRCITNIFSGRTGTRLALEAFRRGHEVCLLTSRPEVVEELSGDGAPTGPRWRMRQYRAFDELQQLMETKIAGHAFDAIIHVAAVSDYAVAGTFALSPGTTFDPGSNTLKSEQPAVQMLDASAGKVKSSHQELWLRLLPTPKLVDSIREPWGFRGVLVKFKLEAGVSETELQDSAERSRRQSDADAIVANTLEGMNSWALIKGREGGFVKAARNDLAGLVIETVETLRERSARSQA